MGKNIRIVFGGIFLAAFLLGACSIVSGGEMGKQAADFSLATLDGGQISLADTLKQRNAVVVFWATWCPYCVAEVPAVEEYSRNNVANVAVIGVDLRENAEKVRAFANEHGISYTIAFDEKGDVASKYNVTGIPTVVAVNKTGKIVYYGHDVNEIAKGNVFGK